MTVEVTVEVTVGAEEGLNETGVGAEDPGEPAAAAVLGASDREDGWRGDGWSLEKGVGVRIGEVVGEEVVIGLFAVLAG